MASPASAQEAKGRTKKVADQRAWACLVQNKLLHHVHRHQEIEWEKETPPRGAWLPTHLANPVPGRAVYRELSQIMSFQQTTPWYSLAAQDLNVAHADLCLAKWCDVHDEWHSLERAWMIGLLTCGTFALRHKSWHPSKRVLPIGIFGSQLTFGWPLEAKSWGKDDLMEWENTYFEIKRLPSDGSVTLDAAAILVPGNWYAQLVTFASPFYNMIRFPEHGLLDGRAASIKVQADGMEALLLCTAARCAFGRLGQPFLSKQASHLGVASGAAGWQTLFQVLTAVIKHVLDCSDEEVLDILRLRLPVPDFAVDDLIMQVDDATDILEAADNKELKRSQQESEEAAERDTGFAAEYAAERSKLIEAGKGHMKKHADLLKVIKG